MNYISVEHVAAGQFRVEKQSSRVLQAYLGTCLGLAIFDSQKKTGGLIHILLPEPTGESSGRAFPEKYAATGVPLLIEKLKNLGCKTHDMKATIAGGALVGPVSQQDINLDIGGRSADITQSILRGNGIEIIKSETGGFFTCTLELNLKTGKTIIKPAWNHSYRDNTNFTPPGMEDINHTIQDLKPIPQTALKIFRMFQESRHAISEITRELSQDQVLSAQTLKLCNSALFAGTIKIETLKDAVLLMGENMLVKSVITAAVNTYFSQTGTSGYSLCRGGLFFHAVGVAHTAEKLAERTGKAEPKHAYTAGLLHDIGKVVLDQYISDAAPLLFRNLAREGASVVSLEKKLLGITHSEAGAFLATKWNFSTALATVIRYHHSPQDAGKHRILVEIVHLADRLMEKFHTGCDLKKNDPLDLTPLLTSLELTMADIEEIIDELPLAALTQNDILHPAG